MRRIINLLDSYYKIWKRKNIFITTTTLLLVFSSFLSWFFVLPLYLRNLGASDEQVGVAYLIFDLALCLFQFPAGFLADRIGRKKIITIPTFIIPFFYVAAGLATSWQMVVVMVALANLLTGAQIPALLSLIAESVEDRDRGLAFGIFSMATSASFALGPGVGSLMSETTGGIRTLLLASAAITLPCAFLRLLFLRDVAKHKEHQVNLVEIFKSFNPDLILCLFSIIFFTFMVNITLYGPFTTLYAKDVMNFDKPRIQLMFMVGGLSAIFTNIISGKITQKLGSRKALILGCLFHTFLYIPWMLSENFFQACGIYLLSYMFLQLSFIGHDTIISDLTELRTRSSIIGIFGMIPGILGAFAPQIGSQLMVMFHPSAPFIAAIAFAVLTSIYLLPIKSGKI